MSQIQKTVDKSEILIVYLIGAVDRIPTGCSAVW